MKICICILNYNSFLDTIECLDSLMNQEVRDFVILIIDNASTNDSVVQIMQDCERKNREIISIEESGKVANAANKIILIKSKENIGFSGGNNIGIAFAKSQTKCNYILFLNNDVIVPENFIGTMLTEYENLEKNHQKIALGSTELNYYSNKISHSGFQYLNLFTGLTFKKPIFPYFKYICGACIMTNIDTPLMDEGYFLYYDDVEYCKILKKNNYKFFVTNKTHYLHKISSTTSKIKETTMFRFVSMWRFFQKNYRFFVPLVFAFRYVEHLITNESEKNNVLKNTFKSK